MNESNTVEGSTPATVATDATDNSRLLEEVHNYTKGLFKYPNEHLHIVHTLWCAQTHFIEAFRWIPKVYITSPEKGCGKSTLLELTSFLVQRPITSFNVTPQAMWRVMNTQPRPSILYDEVDNIFLKKDTLDLKGLINASSKRGAKVYRCHPKKPEEWIEIEAFSNVALCGIEVDLPDTIADRTIFLRLEKPEYPPSEIGTDEEVQGLRLGLRLSEWPKQQFSNKVKTISIEDKEGNLITSEVPYTNFDYICSLKKKDVLPTEIKVPRIGDNWFPLFAVAVVADVAAGSTPHWTTKALEAFNWFEDKAKHYQIYSPRVQLLTHIQECVNSLKKSLYHFDYSYKHKLPNSIEGKHYNLTQNTYIPSILLAIHLKENYSDTFTRWMNLRQCQDLLANILMKFNTFTKDARINLTSRRWENGGIIHKPEQLILKSYYISDLEQLCQKWVPKEEVEESPPPTRVNTAAITATVATTIKPKTSLHQEYLEFMNRDVPKHERFFK